jgi:hypothetical protein
MWWEPTVGGRGQRGLGMSVRVHAARALGAKRRWTTVTQKGEEGEKVQLDGEWTEKRTG